MVRSSETTRLAHTTRAWTSGEGRISRWASECGNVEALSKSFPALMLAMYSGSLPPSSGLIEYSLLTHYWTQALSHLNSFFQRQVTLHFPWRSGENCQQECCKGCRGRSFKSPGMKLFATRCGWTSGEIFITVWTLEPGTLTLEISRQGKLLEKIWNANLSGEVQAWDFMQVKFWHSLQLKSNLFWKPSSSGGTWNMFTPSRKCLSTTSSWERWGTMLATTVLTPWAGKVERRSNNL